MSNEKLLAELEELTKEIEEECKKYRDLLTPQQKNANKYNYIKEKKKIKKKSYFKQTKLKFNLRREIENYDINRKPKIYSENGQRVIQYGYQIPGNLHFLNRYILNFFLIF